MLRWGPCRAGRGINISGAALDAAALRRGACPAVTTLFPGRAAAAWSLSRPLEPSPLPVAALAPTAREGPPALCPGAAAFLLRARGVAALPDPLALPTPRGGLLGGTSGLFPMESAPWEGLSRSCSLLQGAAGTAGPVPNGTGWTQRMGPSSECIQTSPEESSLLPPSPPRPTPERLLWTRSVLSAQGLSGQALRGPRRSQPRLPG